MGMKLCIGINRNGLGPYAKFLWPYVHLWTWKKEGAWMHHLERLASNGYESWHDGLLQWVTSL